MAFDLERFVLAYFEAKGALLEERDGVTEMFLPEGEAAAFGREWLAFAFLPEKAEGAVELASYGTPLIEKILEQAAQRGLTAKWYVWADVKKTLKLPDIASRIAFFGCRPALASAEARYVPHALFTFRVSYISDEIREELRPISVNLLSNRAKPSYPSQPFLTQANELAFPEWEPPPLQEAYRMACLALEKAIQPRIADHYHQAERKLKRETDRIAEYFAANEAELLQRASRDEKRREVLLKKVEINRLEKERKLKDLQNKYRLSLRAKLANVALVYIPMIQGQLVLLDGKNKPSGEVVVFWDAVAKSLDLPSCPLCGDELSTLGICPTCRKALCRKDLGACPHLSPPKRSL